MSEPTNDPPLVLRPEAAAETPRAEKQRKPHPGFWEAVLWCLIFLSGQIFALVVTAVVVFTVLAMQAPDSKVFTDTELDGLKEHQEHSPISSADKPALPPALARSIGWGMVVAPFVSLTMIAIVLPRRIGPGWKRQISVRLPHWLHVVLILLMFPGFAVAPDVIQLVMQWATGWKPEPSAETGALKDIFNGFPWMCTALAVAIGPGVVEEFWCRGFLGRGLCSRYGFVVGILLTSCLFAAMHMNPAQFLIYVCMGAFLHFVYLASRSIWIPILLHVLNNGTAILMALTLTPEQISKPTPVELWIAAYVVLVAGGFALWTSRAKEEPREHGDEAWSERDLWKPESPGISAPPPEANVRISYTSKYPVVKGISIALTFVSVVWLFVTGYRALFQN